MKKPKTAGKKKKKRDREKKIIRKKEVGAECSCYYKFLGTFPEM